MVGGVFQAMLGNRTWRMGGNSAAVTEFLATHAQCQVDRDAAYVISQSNPQCLPWLSVLVWLEELSKSKVKLRRRQPNPQCALSWFGLIEEELNLAKANQAQFVFVFRVW